MVCSHPPNIINIQSKCIIFIYSLYKRLNDVQQPIYSKSVYEKRARAVRVKPHLGDLDFVVGWGLGVKQVSF